MRLNDVVIKEGGFKPLNITVEFTIQNLDDLREFQAIKENGVYCTDIKNQADMNLVAGLLDQIADQVITNYNK